jgi:hypothetical protein
MGEDAREQYERELHNYIFAGIERARAQWRAREALVRAGSRGQAATGVRLSSARERRSD